MCSFYWSYTRRIIEDKLRTFVYDVEFAKVPKGTEKVAVNGIAYPSLFNRLDVKYRVCFNECIYHMTY